MFFSMAKTDFITKEGHDHLVHLPPPTYATDQITGLVTQSAAACGADNGSMGQLVEWVINLDVSDGP